MTTITALTLAAFLAGARCEDELLREIEKLSARVDAIFPLAPDSMGGRAALLQTEALGVWLRVTVESNGEPHLERVTETLVERHRFGTTCEPQQGGEDSRPKDDSAWSDAALAEKLKAGGAGVILLWSPHMPLSVDAYVVLEALTREMGLDLIVLLHPDADASYARSVALERGMASSVLRPLGGIELAFRGMTTHAPSVQVFAAGRLKGPVVPGYRDEAALRLEIGRALEEDY